MVVDLRPVFVVKSLYNFLSDGGQRDLTCHHLWRLKIPIKIKTFFWLLLRKRHPTADRLLARGMSVVQHCVFCASSTETYDHLFWDCVFIRYLLLSVVKLPNSYVADPSDVRQLWTSITNTHDVAKRSVGLSSFAAIWWVAWTERNNIIFNAKATNAIRALDRANLLVQTWIDHL